MIRFQQEEEPVQFENNFLQLTLDGFYGQKIMSCLLQKPKKVKKIDLKGYVSSVDKQQPKRIILLESDLDDYEVISSPNGEYFCINVEHEKQIYFFNVNDEMEALLGKYDYSEKKDIKIFIKSEYALLYDTESILIVPFNNQSNLKINQWIEGDNQAKLFTNDEKLIHFLDLKKTFTKATSFVLKVENGYFTPFHQADLKIQRFYRKNFIITCQQYLMSQIPITPKSFVQKHINSNAYFGGKYLDYYFKYFGLTILVKKKVRLYNLFRGKLIKKFTIDCPNPYELQNSKIYVQNNDLVIQVILCDISYHPKMRQKLIEIQCFRFQQRLCEKIFEQINSDKARSEIRGGVIEFYSF